MKTLNEEQMEKLIRETTVLAEENCNNELVIQQNIHKLLDNSPGDTLKIRAKNLTDRFMSNGISYSYLRKLIRMAALEIKLKLPPGTLKEYHARLLLEVKKLPQLILIYERALELAGSDSLRSPQIIQAIKEINTNKNATEEKLSSKNVKPTKGITINKAGKGTYKKSDSEIDNCPISDYEDEVTERATPQALYQDIEPSIKSMENRILLVRVLTSNNFWDIGKKLFELELSAIKAKELINLVDPNGECQAIIAAKIGNKRSQYPINKVRTISRKKPAYNAPLRTLFD